MIPLTLTSEDVDRLQHSLTLLEKENMGLREELDCSCNAEELRQVRAENARLREAINAFCSGQAWADESWKNQPHIKALFDLSNDQGHESPPKKNTL